MCCGLGTDESPSPSLDEIDLAALQTVKLSTDSHEIAMGVVEWFRLSGHEITRDKGGTANVYDAYDARVKKTQRGQSSAFAPTIHVNDGALSAFGCCFPSAP